MKEQKVLSILKLPVSLYSALLVLFVLHLNTSFGQVTGTIPVTGSNNCSITPAGTVCPNTVRTYYAPSGMSGYSWSITGSGTITGSGNARSVNITAGSECGYSFKLTVVMSASGVQSSCSQIINITDNTLPVIVAAANKTIPINSTNIVFDNPTISDNCGTPTLVVVSTTSSTGSDGSLNYTRTWKAVDACGNSSSTCSQTVTQFRSLTCTITGNNSICQGASTSLCSSPGAASYLWSTGATSQCITITSPGNYTVTAFDGQGGSSTCSQLVSLATPIGCSITGNSAICSGGSTNLCGPSGAISYIWSTGATTRCINVNTAGTYTLSIIENSGCTSSCTTAVTIGPPPACNISGNSTVCQGSSTNLCAPAGATSYVWSNGAITPCISVTNAGNYSVTVTNASGCSSSCSKSVSINSTPSCTISGVLFICPGGSTEICAPAGMIAYSWSTGATTRCITVNNIGVYSVIVTASNGCTSSCSQTVDAQATTTCNISGSTSICPGGSISLCATAGAASYAWSTGAQTQCISVNAAGTYTVTITNASGCTTTCSKTITMNTPPVCSITGIETICPGGSTQLCAPQGSISYLWSTGATSECITVRDEGTYTVTIANAAGCSSTCSKTVTQNNPPACSITGNLSFCTGGSTNLCAPAGASSYSWSTGATSQCITVNSAGSFSVTITDGNGCSSTCNKNVNINTSLACVLTGNTSICSGSSTSICAPAGAASYAWSTGAQTQCISVNAAGTYTVTITNASGCTTTCSKTITMNTPPVCSITGIETICPGGSTQLCAPQGSISYLWSTGATSECITVRDEGTYTVTITNAAGCSSTCSKTVTQNNPPACSITGNLSFCTGGSTNLCAPAGASSYSWSTGATSQCITVNSAGSFSVTITDGNGCSSTCNKNVNTNTPLPCIITGNTSICSGSSTSICAPAGAASYAWSTGATTQCLTLNSAGNYSVTVVDAQGCSTSCNKNVTVNNPAVCSINGNNSFCQGGTTTLCQTTQAMSYAWSTGATTQCISVTSAGSYSVSITDENGCVSTCSKTVTQDLAPPCFITGSTSFCSGGSSNLCAPPGATSYQWSTGATTECINVTTAGNYSVTITTTAGCTSTCNKNVTIMDPPTCSISGNLLICNGNSSELCASPGAASYLWSNGSTNQCLTINTSGQYRVTLTGGNGCTASCSQNIDILPTPNCNVTGTSTICSGGTANLCATHGAVAYAWNTGATTQCINPSSPGIYTTTITGSNGCTSSCSKSVVVNIPMTCSITGSSSICSGSSTTLCVPGNAATYEWSNEGTTSCISVNSAGTYSVLITDANGCISTCSQTVTVTQLPTCNITGNSDICGGSNTLLTATGGNSYLWSTGATTSSITVSNPETYTVTVSNSNQCTATCSKTVNTHACGVTLKKSPDICEFPDGTPTTVNFTYEIKNNSDFYNASGELVDDNGTPNNTADDINVCSWGPILPGESTKCYKSFNINTTHTNTARATGISGGQPVTSSSTATVTGINCNCNLSYPDNSNLPRSAVIFNESEVLRTSDPGPTSCGSTGSVIKMWYNDEHALLLGVRSVSVKTFSGTTTTNYPVTSSPAPYGCVANPLVGDTISTGDQAANDLSAGGGRPIWPAIFITDLTVNGPNSRIGDWQQGGKGIMPTKVCGTWKSATKFIDKTKNPPKITILTDVNPTKNNWNLGSGSNTPPGGFASLDNEGYGAEISWDVNSLGLIPGHTYRLVFMVHDGDQNKTGGDVGETCTTIHIPDADCIPVQSPPPPPPPPTVDKVCYTGISHRYVKASQEWTINTTTNNLTIRTTFSKNFVDNTYGTSSIGWPSGHTFNQLVGSDNLQMSLFDANNVKKMEFKLDYITASNTVPSGYKCLGVTGGEGQMILGNVSDVVSVTTSIDKNLNTFGYPLTTNSPATNSSYSPNAAYPNWIYDVWYEVTVKLTPFGSSGFGRPKIASVHASPSKTGSNTELVEDTICTQSSPRIAAPDAPTRINAIVYPNPFGDDITINFITPLEKDATITITDLAGRIVESFNHPAGSVKTGGDLRAGIYFVTISQGDFRRTIKIVKSSGLN